MAIDFSKRAITHLPLTTNGKSFYPSHACRKNKIMKAGSNFCAVITFLNACSASLLSCWWAEKLNQSDCSRGGQLEVSNCSSKNKSFFFFRTTRHKVKVPEVCFVFYWNNQHPVHVAGKREVIFFTSLKVHFFLLSAQQAQAILWFTTCFVHSALLLSVVLNPLIYVSLPFGNNISVATLEKNK